MKVVLLAGGYGTRLSEETNSRSKLKILVDKEFHCMNLNIRKNISFDDILLEVFNENY